MGVRGMREWVERGCVDVASCPMLCAVNNTGVFSNVVDIFNVTSGTWSTAALSQARSSLAATSLPNAGVAFFAGGVGTSFHFCV
jgi:hypothetical protein